jgi:3-hydroxyacyl-CoA dehydrogenase
MVRRLNRAAVLGSGVMGGAIAAHLANAGVPVLLLDMVPSELTDDERRRGLTLADPRVRNRFSNTGKERALKAHPASFFTPARAQLVTTGNFEDDLPKIRAADWIIEAVVEDLAVKQKLLDQVERHRRDDAIVSTNTSGLPVHQIATGRSERFRRSFLGTHFFNPPRYLKLLEIIPLPDTDPDVVATASHWGEWRLGKGVVYAHDRPNFIANRIGGYASRSVVHLMLEMGLTVEEVDELTGPLIGRPRSATFRTMDLVGLDTAILVTDNAYRNLADDEERDVFIVSPLMREMATRGWLGEKSGGGFYKRVNGEIHALDYKTMEYRPRQKVAIASVESAKLVDDPQKRLRQLLVAPDKAGQFLWRLTSSVLVYAAKRVPEISDDIVNVDRAMRWGFAWEHGPFETWDLLGVSDIAKRLQEEGREVPPLVRAVMDAGETFYREHDDGSREFFDLQTRAYRPEPDRAGVMVLSRLKKSNRVIASNPGASLVDLGDGIACLEFHSKLNTIGEDTVRMVYRALDESRKYLDGLVIGNQGQEFSAGANLMLLLLEAQEGNWDELGLVVRQFQKANLALRYFELPVVAAPFGRTLAGGCEVCLPCARIQAAAETYIGLVETGVGLIPAGGGTTEMVRRTSARVPNGEGDLFPFARWVFETIALAKVSTSAEEAFALGYLREGDSISMHSDHLIRDAKEACLALVRTGYRPPLRIPIRVTGERGLSAFESYLYLMKIAGNISEYDVVVGTKLAHVVCGGRVPYGTELTEEYLHDLEREAFLNLLGQPKTLERIRHTLKTGRPLRN